MWQGRLQQGAVSTQNIRACSNNWTNTVNNKIICHLNGQVRTRHPPLPPAFDNWPPASHQQIAHWLGHSLDPILTEPPWGSELPARPGFGLCLNPGKNLVGMFLRIRSDIYLQKIMIYQCLTDQLHVFASPFQLWKLIDLLPLITYHHIWINLVQFQ